MSILGMMEGKPAFLGVGGAEHQPTHFTDVVGAAFQSGALNIAKDRSVNDARRERDDKYKSLTGRDLYSDVIDTSPDRSTLQLEYMSNHITGTGHSQKLQDATDAYVSGLRQNDPERYKDIGTSADILQRAKQRTLDAEAHSSDVSAGAGTAARIGGELVGGFGSGMFDPVNIAAMGLSIPGTSGIIKVALREAAINGGISAVSSPLTAGWRKELGKEYGPGEWATDVGVGALFGGGFGLLLHGAGAGLGKAKSFMFSKFADAFGLRGNIEAATAAKIESRRTHLDESNPANLQPDVPAASGERPIEIAAPEKLKLVADHNAALAEVDAAVNEGRAVKAENIPFSDEQIANLDRSKMEPGLADFHERATDETPLAPSDAKAQIEKSFNEHGVRTYEPEDIAFLKKDIQQGEPGERGHDGDGKSYGKPSTYPDYFKGKGYTKAEAIKVIDKYQKGHIITDKQSSMLADLHDGMQAHHMEMQDHMAEAERLDLLPYEPPTVEGQKSLEEMYHSPEMIAKEHADFEAAFKGNDSHQVDLGPDGIKTIKEIRESFKSDDEFLAAVSVCGIGAK